MVDSYTMAEGVNRPVVVTILAVLEFISAILCFIAGAVMIAGIASFSDFEIDFISSSLVGIPFIACGLLSLIMGYGFWKGWSIMWYLGVIFSILGLIFTFITIIGLIIYILILYYLFRPGVKAWFGV